MTIVISNLTQFKSIANSNPQVLNIGPFSIFREIFSKKGKGCNCNNSKELAQYRVQFEACFSMLSDGDKTALKTALGATKLCYYTREANGSFQQNCF
jgi:hypothetical protein